MKTPSILIIALCLSFLSLMGCKEDKTEPLPTDSGNSTLSMKFQHTVNGSPLIKNSASFYTNSAGDEFSVSTLQYYISNIELTRSDNSKVKFGVYKLVDGFEVKNQLIGLTNVPNGDYKAISFFIGIDSARNHSGSQDGDLSPAKGMLWTWASGYLFLKLEGFYKKGGSQESYRYHIGTDKFLNKLTYPISFSMDKTNKEATFECDLAEFFKNPNTFSIQADDDIQSFPSEEIEAGKLAENMKDMIKIIKIQ